MTAAHDVVTPAQRSRLWRVVQLAALAATMNLVLTACSWNDPLSAR